MRQLQLALLICASIFLVHNLHIMATQRVDSRHKTVDVHNQTELATFLGDATYHPEGTICAQRIYLKYFRILGLYTPPHSAVHYGTVRNGHWHHQIKAFHPVKHPKLVRYFTSKNYPKKKVEKYSTILTSLLSLFKSVPGEFRNDTTILNRSMDGEVIYSAGEEVVCVSGDHEESVFEATNLSYHLLNSDWHRNWSVGSIVRALTPYSASAYNCNTFAKNVMQRFTENQ